MFHFRRDLAARLLLPLDPNDLLLTEPALAHRPPAW